MHSICFSISKIHSRLIFTVLSACRCNIFRPYLSRPVQGSAYTRVGLYASIYGTCSCLETNDFIASIVLKVSLKILIFFTKEKSRISSKANYDNGVIFSVIQLQ